jgi:hypothetical protein
MMRRDGNGEERRRHEVQRINSAYKVNKQRAERRRAWEAAAPRCWESCHRAGCPRDGQWRYCPGCATANPEWNGQKVACDHDGCVREMMGVLVGSEGVCGGIYPLLVTLENGYGHCTRCGGFIVTFERVTAGLEFIRSPGA